MVKGLLVHSCRVYSDKFHELCCSHLFCRIIDISPHKGISNDKNRTHHCEDLVETIETDISLAIFGVPTRKSSMNMPRNSLEYSGTITKQEFYGLT
jgi:hypothetical protein